MRLLGGHPLLWHTIRASVGANSIQHTIVSTDSAEIAAFVSACGIHVLQHPADLSADGAPTYPVIRWAFEEWSRLGNKSEFCVVLRATTPFRSSVDIDAALGKLFANRAAADSIVSVVEATGVHPVRLKRVTEQHQLIDAFDTEGHIPIPRQAFEKLFMRNGGIYASTKDVVETLGLWGNHCLAYVMPEERSLNINTEFDFIVAELLAEKLWGSAA